jgi:hypothetical protein
MRWARQPLASPPTCAPPSTDMPCQPLPYQKPGAHSCHAWYRTPKSRFGTRVTACGLLAHSRAAADPPAPRSPPVPAPRLAAVLARSSLSSKVVSQYSSLLSPMAVDAVLKVMDPARPNMLDLRDIKVRGA